MSYIDITITNNSYLHTETDNKPDSALETLARIKRIVSENLISSDGQPISDQTKKDLLIKAQYIKEGYVKKFEKYNSIRSWCCLSSLDGSNLQAIKNTVNEIAQLVPNSNENALVVAPLPPQMNVTNPLRAELIFKTFDVLINIFKGISISNLGNLTKVSNLFKPLWIQKAKDFKFPSIHSQNLVESIEAQEANSYLNNLFEVIKFEYNSGRRSSFTFIPEKYIKFCSSGIDFEETLKNIQNLNEKETSELKYNLNTCLLNLAITTDSMDYERTKRAVLGSQILGSNIEIKNTALQTPLALACGLNNFSIVKILIEAGANLEAKNAQGQTPLAIAAKTGNKEIVEILIKAGADVNAKDNDGNTPLMLAIDNDRQENGNLLLKARANLDLQNNEGETALHCALLKNSYESEKIIHNIINNYKPNYNIQDTQGEIPLEIAFEKYTKEKSNYYKEVKMAIVEELISKTDLNANVLSDPLRKYLAQKSRKNVSIEKKTH